MAAVATDAGTVARGESCVLRVPAKVNVGATVTATVAACPAAALSGYLSWVLRASADDTLWFSRDAAATNPTGGLTDIYGAEVPGTYRFSAAGSDHFCQPDSADCPTVSLSANVVVAKYRTTTALQVVRSTVTGKPVTRLSTQVRRYTRFGSAGLGAATVTIYRDNKVLTSTKTTSAGVATVSVADTKGSHTYKAVAAESGTAWSATSNTVRK
ncbi:hypothetical protein [Cryptosporangium minutisporangium]|uniref:hypothetical protein n=1 Tax=Cryptosporangium minutisporangium TaxID=113569 RepID=UPI0031EAF4F3